MLDRDSSRTHLMPGRTRQWIGPVPGASAGQPPIRRVRYLAVGGASARGLFVELTYRLHGLWLLPGARAGESLLDIPGGRDSWDAGRPRVPLDVFSIAVPRLATLTETRSARVESELALDGAYALPTVAELEPDSPGASEDAPHGAPGSHDWYPPFVVTWAPAAPLDGLHRIVVTVAPVAHHAGSRRLKVRHSISAETRCDLPGDGRYRPGEVDWTSPIIQGVVGADAVNAWRG